MNTLVIFSGLLAVALASGYGGLGGEYAGGYGGYHGGYAQIIIGKGGVPIDTPEVQAARAAHFAAHAQAGYGGAGGYIGGGEGAYFGGEGGYGKGGYYHGPLAHIIIGPKGVPIDTPEVQAARAKHLAALAGAGSYGGYGGGDEKEYY